MKKNFVFLFFLLLLVACKKEEDTQTISDVAQVTSFSFVAQDSFPGLAAATFVVEELSDTGMIEVTDSLAFGTPLNKVVPKMTFRTTPGTVRFFSAKDTVSFTGSGKDSIDFSVSPMRLVVYASDLEHYKWYHIKVYAHQVNPNLFHWNLLTSGLTASYPCQQKALKLGNKFLLFCNDGFQSKLFTSPSGAAWVEQPLTGLPDGCAVNAVVLHDDTLYCCDSTHLYLSSNGSDWETAPMSSSCRLKTLLMSFNHRLWAILESDEHLQLAYWENRQWKVLTGCFEGDVLPLSFPVSDFATVTYLSSSQHTHALVAGGYNRDGQMLNAIWNIEYNGQYRVVNYADQIPSSKPFAGASIVNYDQSLWRIGGITGSNTFMPLIQHSLDEGLHWSNVEASLCPLAQTGFSPRRNVSAFVDDNNLYLIGGKSEKQTFMDVYQGRINEIDFKIR